MRLFQFPRMGVAQYNLMIIYIIFLVSGFLGFYIFTRFLRGSLLFSLFNIFAVGNNVKAEGQSWSVIHVFFLIYLVSSFVLKINLFQFSIFLEPSRFWLPKNQIYQFECLLLLFLVQLAFSYLFFL